MEEVEIALALLEIIAISLPLALAALGMVFRVLQSMDIRRAIGVDGLLKLGYITGLLLGFSISAGLLAAYVSIFLESVLVILAIGFLTIGIGILGGLGLIFLSIFSRIYQSS